MPDDVLNLLKHQKKFTGKGDLHQVDQLYRSFFEGATHFARRLDFSGLEWGDREAQQLVKVLPSFVKLTGLDLSKNHLQTAG